MCNTGFSVKKAVCTAVFTAASIVCVCAGQNDAWTTATSLCIDFPIVEHKVEYNSISNKIKANGFDFDVSRFFISNKNNIALSINAGVGYIQTDDILPDSDKMPGISFKFGGGVGYAFVNENRYLIVLSCIAELDFNYLFKKYRYTAYGNTYDMNFTANEFTFNLGADFLCGMKLNSRAGLTCGVRTESVITGSCELSAEYKNVSASKSYTEKTGGLSVYPRIGMIMIL